MDVKTPTLTYSVGLVGVRKDNGNKWFARVDLDGGSKGQGPCGHSRLHVHVGEDPNEAFQTRVPTCFLTPGEALAWLLANCDPALEPNNDG